MERIGIIGRSWRIAPSADLAALTLPLEQRDERLPELRRTLRARELVYLATCNRVELILVADEDEPIAEFRPRVFRALLGREPLPGEAQRRMGRVRASPLARRLAEEWGVDLTTVKGSGPDGRIVRRDIEAVARAATGGAPATEAPATTLPVSAALRRRKFLRLCTWGSCLELLDMGLPSRCWQCGKAKTSMPA